MRAFLNGIKAHATMAARSIGAPRFGILENYDPKTATGRVTLQPDNVLTGWLPIVSPWGGDGWGDVAHFTTGEQVCVIQHEGDGDNGIILGRVCSDAEQPAGGVGGERWIVHKSGSYVKLTNDGHVHIGDASGTTLEFTNNGTVVLTGNLLVTGDITDRNRTGSEATLADFRAAYDAHGHPYNAGTTPSTTGTTNEPV
jgi:uncharacterized protein involved in type VI secretion and phage assembly